MGKSVKIEIMDTTLRDGEQTSGVSFVPHEKLMIARLLLEDLKVDRVEVASARVSDGEFEAVKMICDWAARRNLLHKVEVLGFVDGRTSVDWIQRTGCRVINLLCKGSLKHCTQQLKKMPEEHIEDIVNVVRYADELDIAVNVYLEDWSNGMKDSSDYVFQLMDGLKDTSIKRYMLPDTLGILNPLQVIEFMRKMKKRYPHTHFDFHAHNDYDLAVSNVLAAVLSGVKGLHTTINGLGERAGNAPLASVQAILKDHFNALTNIDESRLNDVSRVVESYSGIVIPANKPIVGENVFTQVAEEHWEINSIKVNSIGIPDPDNAYAVKLKDKSAASQVELTPEGIIKAINTTSPIEKAPVTKVADTAKKRIDPRSFMTEEILIAGSTAKMAELVAKEIYNIRESKNSLTRGQADYMPKDGAALKLMLDNLDEQEQAMMQMFAGTTDRTEKSFTIRIKPEAGMKEKVAFRFSKKLGMLDADNLSGEPYYISIINQETLPPVDPKGKEKKKMDGVIYNIPGKAQVTVFTPNKRYFDGELPVTQFGTTECLVDNLFNKKVNTRVIFNPNTGGIVKIDKD
mgnify:CR=1 FL=1